MKRVLKWVVPVDDMNHGIGEGPIVHVGHQGSVDEVAVWTVEEAEGHVPATRQAHVVGTGHRFPNDGTVAGSVQVPHGLVWHLVVFP